MSGQILLDRTQCPECFSDMELVGLMDESVWEAMSIPERSGLCKMAGIDGKHGSKSYDQLEKLQDWELLAICDYHCNGCDTDWPAHDLLPATQTPHQLENYMREHRNDKEE